MRDSIAWLLLVVACSPEIDENPTISAQNLVRLDHADVPLPELEPEQLRRFREGDALFEGVFREADGLGPLFIRSSCSDCHRDDGRGPGLVTRAGFTTLTDEATLRSSEAFFRFGDTERPYLAAGAKEPLLAPRVPGVIVSQRLPPAVFGRGYVEAVLDSEIERLARAAEERTGPIRGRLALLPAGPGDEKIGRFGLKARTATLTEFTAEALQGDMGITTPFYPNELENPEGLTDDQKPGVDLDRESVERIADYMRLLALPERPLRESSPVRAHGEELFSELGCALCHVPTLRTRPDYPIRQLADVDAPLYSDLLLHDMGDELADGVREGAAGPREWRTAPLMGLRFSPSFLHDGRARSLEEAIVLHGGPGSEARSTVEAFLTLPEEEKSALLEFVSGL